MATQHSGPIVGRATNIVLPRLSVNQPAGFRRLSDWTGFLSTCLLGVWTIWSGWLPIARQSWLAAVLMVPSWLMMFVIGIGFLRRQPLLAWDRNLAGRAVAYFVTYSLPLEVTIMRNHLPPMAMGGRHIIAVLLSLTANVIAVWCAWTLRSAMSLEPQARVLITTGPFRYARHPLYAAYLLGVISFMLLYFSIIVATSVLIWCLCLLYRAWREERVLAGCFPEYADFKKQVGMFSPRLF